MRRTAALGVLAGLVLVVPAVTAPAPDTGEAGTAVPSGAEPVVSVPRPDAPTPTDPDGPTPGDTSDGTPDVPDTSGATGDRAAPVSSPEGHLVAAGTAAAGSGPILRYSVEVDPATGLDPDEVAAIAETALGDVRSWARIRRLVRTDDPATADARLLVAPPAVVDALCAEAGLDTAGVYSCWNGRFVALNAWRWATGAYGFPDVATYRLYLVNHEVGHVLGRGHVACPADGGIAPLMMQQSKGLGGCTANGWPYPG